MIWATTRGLVACVAKPIFGWLAADAPAPDSSVPQQRPQLAARGCSGRRSSEVRVCLKVVWEFGFACHDHLLRSWRFDQERVRQEILTSRPGGSILAVLHRLNEPKDRPW